MMQVIKIFNLYLGIIYEIFIESFSNYWNIFILYNFVEIETLEKIKLLNIFSHKISIQLFYNFNSSIYRFENN